MMGMNDVIETLDDALMRKGLSDAAASMLAANNPSVIKNLRLQRGAEKRYNYATLEKLANVLGLELYFGPPRQNQDETLLNPTDFVMVQRFDVALSAGPGSAATNAPELAPVAFRADWLTSAGLVAKDCCVVSVRSDSMKPLLQGGELVLIDRRQGRAIQNGRTYAFVDVSGDVRVKRLEQLESLLILRSDNPEWPTETRTPSEANQMQIIGPIVWSGRAWQK